MNSDGFHVRAMRPDEVALPIYWAAGEGWNPGLADAACFARADPHGFFLGELDGEAAATISVVNYGERFAFLGFYIVRRDLRGRGYGLRIWQAGMAHAGERTVGLDGVIDQQENYKKSGFTLAYRNVRHGGTIKPAEKPARGIVDLAAVPFAAVLADDATVFPARRTGFLRGWTGAPGHVGRALMRDGKLVAWGVIRSCRVGCKIGPLIADDFDAAAAVFDALVIAKAGGDIFIDVPEPNREAAALADERGLAPVFETARMYTGPIRPIALPRIYGVTTFELG